MSSLLRVRLPAGEVTAAPGQPVRVAVEVSNASEVIDGVTASLGAPGGEPEAGLAVRADPPMLPLFPEGTGVITLELVASPTYAAGAHELEVQLFSSVRPGEELAVPLVLVVTPAPAATLTLTPMVREGRHKAQYSLICENLGNTPLELNLAASDPERVAQPRFRPTEVRMAPGGSAPATLVVRARRHLLGGEVSHRLMVLASSPELEVDTQATFRQQPVIPRGARTVLVLGTIIALWASVFVIGLHRALAADPLTKAVPPSFYAADTATEAHASSAAGASGDLNLQTADSSSGAVPAGAVPKSGVVVGVGGTVSGQVVAASTQAGIGRITVEAFAEGPSGASLVSSAASGSDGSYSLVGLLPGQYELRFSAQGYQDLWYPDATSQATARPVTVDAMSQTGGIDVVIHGAPATISGTVQTGQTPSPPVTITVQPGQGSTTPVATVTTDASGAYTIPDLPAPGTYDLSFSAPGYQVGTSTVQVLGGEQYIANTMPLSAGPGSITGTVTDGTNPLGGVKITAAANGQTVRTATPTTGTVGQFQINNLATPATYLLTFTDSGYGTQTVAEHLGPGQNLTDLAITMAGGAGQVTGTVTSATGGPLGGVTVTVSGGGKPITTETLTAGQVGTYDVSGLATPGSYTLTFSLQGYVSQTLPVTLSSSGSATNVDATLPVGTGSIIGTVTSSAGKAPLTGVSVSATDGLTTVTTTTSSTPPGGYTLSGLAPGSYSITFTLTGYGNVTTLVHLSAGQTATQPIVLAPAT